MGETLKGRTALVTGGGTGIGRAIALRLAREGINIVVNYSRSENEALEVEQTIVGMGVEAAAHKADVSNDSQVREMVAETLARFGRLDILINCAGTTNFVPLEDLEGLKEEYWDRAMNVNAKGIFFCCRAAAEELKKRRGHIVNITSTAGLNGRGSSLAYAASKAAAISVTKSLALVLAPEVRVNSIAPGIVGTRWWVEGQEENFRRGCEGTLLEEIATPEYIADTVYALIAHTHVVTGQNIVIDGGKNI